eukprot:CAMPEP_0113564588 /NCGR_PEP_ID=MMETSP0015_2-20120614/21703_1 /TAXON_ID=2838 /ORGANISM="Odontella" /LENGTH=34 /DNA_ID=CAMNT_0000466687 /DNA_START=114 /DNA_END=215 /DNA_ORIENTATION=+ /assembly_acc=CAM_ASM_000160
MKISPAAAAAAAATPDLVSPLGATATASTAVFTS